MARRVVVVGAGAAGLAVLRRFSESPGAFEIVCFEQLSSVAGLWNYSDVITDLDHPTGSRYTPVYKYMRTNLPRQIMLFDGCQYPDDLPSFISHVHVRDYLERFADKFHLQEYIKFNKKVTKVEPKMELGKEDKWSVRVADVHSKRKEDFEFDIVIVCSGRHSTPNYPKIRGLDVFRGRILHSQMYRYPEDFRGKRVLVVGGGPSGVDISDEISNYADKTWLSIRGCNSLNISEKIVQLGEITRLTSDSAFVVRRFDGDDDDFSAAVTCAQSSELPPEDEVSLQEIGPIDVLIFCTGFYYSYPFLSADSGVAITSPVNVEPLYKDLVCSSRPSLAFVGLLEDVVAFSLFDCQARFLLALYLGRISLPSDADGMEREMKEYEALKRAHNVDTKRFPFRISGFHWHYLTHLASAADFEPPPFFIGDFLQKLIRGGLGDIISNRNMECRIGEDGLLVLV